MAATSALRTCSGCNKRKMIGAHRRDCPECRSDYDRQQKIGVTREQFHGALKRQKGTCAIRGCDQPAKVADHNHDTGTFRGALCALCNLQLAIVENAKRSRALLDYLMKTDPAVRGRHWYSRWRNGSGSA